MLKISERKQANRALVLQLEGRVVGPWVEELRQICAPLLADKIRLTLDLAQVSFTDENGVLLLSRLARLGVNLRRPSPFVAEQLKATNGQGV